jgi:tetratricopeptide (TPR) repeat protein
MLIPGLFRMPALRRFAAVAALVFAPAAFADGVSAQAQNLIEQNQPAQALQLLDAHLARNPQDAEARFTRGLALVRLDRSKDAIRVFADLTRDYPQLPEPYNNLAVLYAAQGEYEKARDALQAALATHPSYATAHENLGDIYAALAGAAYNRALQLDESNQVLRRKLALLNQLDPSAASEMSTTATAAAAVTAAPAPAAAAATADGASADEPAAAPAPAVPAELSPESQAALRQLIDAWAAAWSGRDLDAYFGAYAENFVPEGGLSRSAWQTQRRERIAAPARIKVTVSELRFTPAGDRRASVSFRQQYESDTFSDTVTKVLDLQQAAGGWKITREYTR